MGCGESKYAGDESEAVDHCRLRSALLAQAIQHRYALADAHAAYAASLRTVGDSLFGFLAAVRSLPPPPPSPVLPIPGPRKPVPAANAAAAAAAKATPAAPKHGHHKSLSGEHIHFHPSDSEDDDENDVLRLHADSPSIPPPGAAAAGAPYSNYSPNAAAPYPNYGMGPPYPPYDGGGSYPYGAGGNYPYGGGGSYPYGSGAGGGYPYGTTGSRGAYPYGAGSGYPPYGGYNGGGGDDQFASSIGRTLFNMSYAKSQPPPSSVTFRQPPPTAEAAVRYTGDSPPRQPYSSYNYQNEEPYPSANYGGSGSRTRNGYFASSSQPQGNVEPAPGRASASSKEEVPPPPSPPRNTPWDFLNPFESYESYYEPYAASSKSSKELREEEGIPDLEDEEQEVVKEAYGDKKFVKPENSGKGKGKVKDDARSSTGNDSHERSKSTDGSITSFSSESLDVVDKNVVAETASRVSARQNVPAVPSKVYHDDEEVMKDIKSNFEKASDTAYQASKMLEVGKMPYYQKTSVYRASMRMICGLPSLSTSGNEEFLHFEEDKAMGCGNLSCTLRKLYMWEKKLLEEVKAEENLRLIYERKCDELRHLDHRGAESEKVDALQRYLRKLSTKISVAIHVVDTISKKISELRDEELWPQTCELIQGLTRMWGGMLECHIVQHHAISQARNIDSLLASARFSDAHMEAVKKLELELLNWIANFQAWVIAQKGYVTSLNEWLKKGLNYVPEVTDDGVPPYSPGQLGAPPVFVICNNWAENMNRISEKEVNTAMNSLASSVLHLWKRHNDEQRQSLMANKDMDKRIRLLEKDGMIMRRTLDAHNRKLLKINGQDVMLSGEVLDDGPSDDFTSLHSSLRLIFEAMENFAGALASSYEVLHAYSEGEKAKAAKAHGKVS